MSNVLIMLAVGILGASLQELVYWYNVRSKLEVERYLAMLKSGKYWSITVLMIFGSGAAAFVWYWDSDPTELREVLIFGAAFPLFLKQAVNGFVHATQRTKLGEGTSTTSPLGDYFGFRS